MGENFLFILKIIVQMIGSEILVQLYKQMGVWYIFNAARHFWDTLYVCDVCHLGACHVCDEMTDHVDEISV